MPHLGAISVQWAEDNRSSKRIPEKATDSRWLCRSRFVLSRRLRLNPPEEDKGHVTILFSAVIQARTGRRTRSDRVQ